MRYRSIVADSARWDDIALRDGDIIISTPPKSGTTWTQMLCALLVFDGGPLPGPLGDVSPWVDMLDRPMEATRRILEAQRHRRIMKTHTPLDGLPMRDGVTYVVVGRDPRDCAISWQHHLANLDGARFMAMRAEAVGLDDLAELTSADAAADPVPDEPPARFRHWMRQRGDAATAVMTLESVLHHLRTGWDRRRSPDVVMLHYADLRADLPGELARLGARLGYELTPARATELADAASIEEMRSRADEFAPNASGGLLRDPGSFFRSGSSGEWRAVTSPEDLAEYDQRVAALVEPDLASWAHLGRLASGVDPDAA